MADWWGVLPVAAKFVETGDVRSTVAMLSSRVAKNESRNQGRENCGESLIRLGATSLPRE